MSKEAEPIIKQKGIQRFAKSALLKMTLCAVFIGLAVVAKLFLSIKIPLLGADGMRISLAGVFTAFPAFICGPIYGGIASAASDFIGYVIKPDGAYIPWLTLTAFAGGVLKGLIWRLFVLQTQKKRKSSGTFSVCDFGRFGPYDSYKLNFRRNTQRYYRLSGAACNKGQNGFARKKCFFRSGGKSCKI